MRVKAISLNSHKKYSLDNEAALSKGTWVKLICGASNEDLPSISDLCALYAFAGVHCIDVAANVAVVSAAREGLNWAESHGGARPWLMISISDGKDIHFRKAKFDPNLCPENCSRPCQKVCPTNAIDSELGIISSLCYGCGRCLSACPLALIFEENQHLQLTDLGQLVQEIRPDAIEIHTAPGRSLDFNATLKALLKSNTPIKRISVSCGLEGHEISPELLANELWQRHSCIRAHNLKPIWQLDGRPMSGDLGDRPAKAAVALFHKLRSISPPGPLQLAGGTNAKTIEHLIHCNRPEGIAFGGTARQLIQPFIEEAQKRNLTLREWPEGWNKALTKAKWLIKPWLIR